MAGKVSRLKNSSDGFTLAVIFAQGQEGKLNSVTGKVYDEIWLTDRIYSNMTIRWEFCVEFDGGKYSFCVII